MRLYHTAALALAFSVNGQSVQNSSLSSSDAQLLSLAMQYVNYEVAFYDYASKYNASDYEAYNFSSWVPGRIAQIRQHVIEWQTILNNTLGSSAPPVCTYNVELLASTAYSFMSDACAFAQESASVFLNMAERLESPIARRLVGSMSTTAARHNAWIYASGFQGPPWTGPFDTPIPIEQAFSFIQWVTLSCPNGTQQVNVPPLLNVNGEPGYDGYTGQAVTLSWNGSDTTNTDLWVNVQDGLGSVNYPLPSDRNITLTTNEQGWVYLTVTNNSNASALNSSNIVTGTTFFHIDFAAAASNPGWNNPASIFEISGSF